MPEPLYTAEEMRRAEAGHDVNELMATLGACASIRRAEVHEA